MRTIRISDYTLKCGHDAAGLLSFREKLETVKHLDRLGFHAIEIPDVPVDTASQLFVKSVAMSVENSIVSVDAGLDEKSIAQAWNSVKDATKPRLRVCVPVSTSQIEYVLKTKADRLVSAVQRAVSSCAQLCKDVEFEALDATRSDFGFLCEIISAAVENGATTVTVCDNAGVMLESEFSCFIDKLKSEVPALSGVCLGVMCSNNLGLADSCSVSAMLAGAEEVKVSCLEGNCANVETVASVLKERGESLGLECSLKNTQLKRTVENIRKSVKDESEKSPFESGVRDNNEQGIVYTADNSIDDMCAVFTRMGYQLSEEDKVKVYDSFLRAVRRKNGVDVKELEAIIASEAMQVPSEYSLESYSATSGNTIDNIAHVKLRKGSEILDGVSLGDGPIDAAFLAIEKITGCHYELDDFQIQAITQGREAMGQTIVKLRHEGKVYSGRGISTDIVGSGIAAYVSALNKISWEEKNR